MIEQNSLWWRRPCQNSRLASIVTFLCSTRLLLVLCVIWRSSIFSSCVMAVHSLQSWLDDLVIYFTIIQQHHSINTIAPSIQKPLHHLWKFLSFCHCQGFFFAVLSGQISAQNLVCWHYSLGYRAQILCPGPLHGPDTIIGFSIMLLDGSVLVTEPRARMDFLFHPFEGWRIGSMLIVVRDWDKPPGTTDC